MCDTEILRTAPLAMVCSGVGDVLGKYIAKADWMIGSIINGETYCDVCGEIVTGAVTKLLDNVDAIRSRTEEGIRVLIEALLLSGVTIMIVGHTRAVASVEHNIAHYWEMMQLLHGHHPPAHGASVGVATLLCWPLFTRFAKEDLQALDIEAIRQTRISREAREQWMLKAFETEAAQSIMRDNPEDFLPWDEQLRRIRTAQARQQETPRRDRPPAASGNDPRRHAKARRVDHARGVRHRRPASEPFHALRQGLPLALHAVQADCTSAGWRMRIWGYPLLR